MEDGVGTGGTGTTGGTEGGPAAEGGGRGGRGVFLADRVLVSNVLDLLFTGGGGGGGGGGAPGSTYMEAFLSGVCGFGGSEDDRCLPTVSMAADLPCPGPPLCGPLGGSGGVGPGGGRLKSIMVP